MREKEEKETRLKLNVHRNQRQIQTVSTELYYYCMMFGEMNSTRFLFNVHYGKGLKSFYFQLQTFFMNRPGLKI